MADKFPRNVAAKIAERAGYICSNPNCNILTVGPAEKNPSLSTKRGKAAHICAASPGGPRYDCTQTPVERAGAANGLWVCSNCSDIIDKNNGIDYSKELLRAWKEKHEQMIAHLLRTQASPLAFARRNTDEALVAQRVLDHLEDRGALYVGIPFENYDHVARSLSALRDYLTSEISNTESESKIRAMVSIIRKACVDYMNNTSNGISPPEAAMNLAVMRKQVGIVVKSIAEQFGATIPSQLRTIVPQ